MFCEDTKAKCQAATRITDGRVHRCLKPAPVIGAIETESPFVLCLEHARNLIHELLDSVPGGARDAARLLAARKAKGAKHGTR